MPVIQWDDHPFLSMKPDPEIGPLALALRALLVDDLDPTRNRCNACRCCMSSEDNTQATLSHDSPMGCASCRGQHVEVPYDFLTRV